MGTHHAWVGTNSRVGLVVVGIHGISQNHIKEYQALPFIGIAAICGVEGNLFPEVTAKPLTTANRRAPGTYTDIRRLFDDKEIEGIAMARCAPLSLACGTGSFRVGLAVPVR